MKAYVGCCSKSGCQSVGLSTTLTLLIYANMVKMKRFDWLYKDKFSIHIDEELEVFQLVNAKIGGAIMGPKMQQKENMLFSLSWTLSVLWSSTLSSVFFRD